MRGYPILNDDLPGRLEDLEKRIARLEQPHNINYAKRLSPESYSIGAFSNVIGPGVFTAQPVSSYLGRIYGPTMMYHIGGQGDFTNGGDALYWYLTYVQLWPAKLATDPPVPETLASGIIPATLGDSSFLWQPSIATTEYIFAPTVLEWDTGPDGLNIDGTYGYVSIKMANEDKGYLRYVIVDNGFIGPEYEHVVP
jgi:hypothetical protein